METTTLVSVVVYLPELQEKKSFKTFEFYKKSCWKHLR